MSINQSLISSFGYAWDGLKTAFKNEPNFRIHTIVGSLVLFVSLFLGLTSVEWFLLLLTIAFVLIMELFNTAIEEIVDLVSPTYHAKAKIAKDVSAAAVFVASIFAIFMGFVILLPKIW